ncbi:restriction endonuclease subunit S [Helicobacter pylori]|uniref:restriction endonuclease subunit S n=1 Tax=Helicobacter pylori TaxID=210 RepID=UPI00165C31CA|nr:restriction endonuclease subunit S [Helicobacter pylori]
MDALTTPSNWQRVRLGDIATFLKGKGLSKSQVSPNAKHECILYGELFTHYDRVVTNIKSFTNIYDNPMLSLNNDVLMSGSAETPDILATASCILKKGVILGGDILIIRPNSNLLNGCFLAYCIVYDKNQVLSKVVGSTVYHLYAKDLKDFEILLPPLNEQIAIANILSDVDRYLYSLDALILKKESVKKALRIKMLNQILASNGVEFRELGDIILSLKTGLNPRSFFKLNTPNANNYYVTIRELEDYTIKFTHQTDRIDDNALSLCLKRSNLEKDDILFSGTGTIGKVSIIEKNPNNWAIKEGIYSIKPNKKIVFPRFLMFCLESSNIQNDIKNKSFGGIVKSIPMNDLQQIQIPLPPLNEQIAIANILSDVDSEIISLKNKKHQFENIKKALNHDLMSAKIRVLKQ